MNNSISPQLYNLLCKEEEDILKEIPEELLKKLDAVRTLKQLYVTNLSSELSPEKAKTHVVSQNNLASKKWPTEYSKKLSQADATFVGLLKIGGKGTTDEIASKILELDPAANEKRVRTFVRHHAWNLSENGVFGKKKGGTGNRNIYSIPVSLARPLIEKV